MRHSDDRTPPQSHAHAHAHVVHVHVHVQNNLERQLFAQLQQLQMETGQLMHEMDDTPTAKLALHDQVRFLNREAQQLMQEVGLSRDSASPARWSAPASRQLANSTPVQRMAITACGLSLAGATIFYAMKCPAWLKHLKVKEAGDGMQQHQQLQHHSPEVSSAHLPPQCSSPQPPVWQNWLPSNWSVWH